MINRCFYIAENKSNYRVTTKAILESIVINTRLNNPITIELNTCQITNFSINSISCSNSFKVENQNGVATIYITHSVLISTRFIIGSTLPIIRTTLTEICGRLVISVYNGYSKLLTDSTSFCINNSIIIYTRRGNLLISEMIYIAFTYCYGF